MSNSWHDVCAAARTRLGATGRLVRAVWSTRRIGSAPPVLLVATWQTLCEAVLAPDAAASACAMEMDVFVTALRHAAERVFSAEELARLASQVLVDARDDDVVDREIFKLPWPIIDNNNSSSSSDNKENVDVAAKSVVDSSSSLSNHHHHADKSYLSLLHAATLAHSSLAELLALASPHLNHQFSLRTASAVDSVDAAVAAIVDNIAIPDSAALMDVEAAWESPYTAAAAGGSLPGTAPTTASDDKKLAVAFSASLARLDSAVPAHMLAGPAAAADDAVVPITAAPVDDALAAIAPTTIPTTTQLSASLRLPEKDCTALMAAARMGHVEVVKLLLGAGATVDQRGGVGESALLIAAACGHETTVRVLVAGGATPNQSARDGGTPLMHAARAGHTGVVRALVQLGAHLDVAAASGDTALMLASAGGHVAAVMVLLEAGALVALARAHDGVTALNLAATHRHTTVMHLLTDCGASCALVIDTATSEERRAQLLQQSQRKCVTCAKSLKPAHVKMCAGCKLVPYCTPECQRTDWKRHKQTCKLWQASKAAAAQVAADSAAAAAEASAAAASAAASAAAATAAAAQALANAKARMTAENNNVVTAAEKKVVATPTTTATTTTTTTTTTASKMTLLEEQD